MINELRLYAALFEPEYAGQPNTLYVYAKNYEEALKISKEKITHACIDDLQEVIIEDGIFYSVYND